MEISPDVAKAFTTLGESCKLAAEALGKAILAAAACIGTIIAQVADFSQLQKAMEMQAALNEAPPRVRRLALYGKKYRTRKKNINRALREKAKRERK